MTKLYVSGPMTGLPEYNVHAFRRASFELRQAGYLVLDPSAKGLIYGWTWKDYMHAALREMLLCDGVALLTGWQDSRGARIEVDLADKLEMEVKMVGFWLDLSPQLSSSVEVCK